MNITRRLPHPSPPNFLIALTLRVVTAAIFAQMAMAASEQPVLNKARERKLRPRLRHLSKRILSSLWKISVTSFLIASFYVAYRQFRLLTYVADTLPPQPPPPRNQDAQQVGSGSATTIDASVNLWRRVETNLPPETDPPNPALYGRGREVCYSIGKPDAATSVINPGDPAGFWQMNSRALCYVPTAACWYGRTLENMMTFEQRGSGKCKVLDVGDGQSVEASKAGLNESCAKWRERQIVSMYGRAVYADPAKWEEYIAKKTHIDPRHHTVQWESSFAIIVPKYEWSYNICHYNRIWNYIMYVVRNLHLFVPDAATVRTIDVMFRSGYTYNTNWQVGIRNATLPALERETGKKIVLRRLRFDYLRDFQCIRRGIVLGREGRVDSFPFFNDSDVWLPRHQLSDSHWPVIPHDSLWVREVTMQASGLPSVGKYNGPGINHFESIRVPPRRVGFLQRSVRSRRRLTSQGKVWFDDTLVELCEKHQMELVYVRANGTQSLVEQVKDVHGLGMVVGLHGANIVNSMFVPAGGALFEIFPWRYVRFYYAAGGNAGLRYSFHEPEGGHDRHCSFKSRWCFMLYRESKILLTNEDREQIRSRIDTAMSYIAGLHRKYPDGYIPLRRTGNMYHFDG